MLMLDDLLFFIGVITAAACFAQVEIQIEGAAGWAENLPTWRLDSPIFNTLFPGRPLTGYHFWTLLFIAVAAHLAFAFGMPWTWRLELRALSFMLFFWVAEDFLWFVLNPHFGVRKFRPKYIKWHRRTWWLICPRDYWIATAIGGVLYFFSTRG